MREQQPLRILYVDTGLRAEERVTTNGRALGIVANRPLAIDRPVNALDELMDGAREYDAVVVDTSAPDAEDIIAAMELGMGERYNRVICVHRHGTTVNGIPADVRRINLRGDYFTPESAREVAEALGIAGKLGRA